MAEDDEVAGASPGRTPGRGGVCVHSGPDPKAHESASPDADPGAAYPAHGGAYGSRHALPDPNPLPFPLPRARAFSGAFPGSVPPADSVAGSRRLPRPAVDRHGHGSKLPPRRASQTDHYLALRGQAAYGRDGGRTLGPLGDGDLVRRDVVRIICEARTSERKRRRDLYLGNFNPVRRSR